MGAPMAGHLLDAGVPLVVYDVRAEAAEVIAASSGRSNASDLKFPRFILNGRFDSGFARAKESQA